MRAAAALGLLGCACAATVPADSRPPAPAPAMAKTTDVPADDGGPLASYPGTVGTPLACVEVCQRKQIPDCPGTGRAGVGKLVVRGLAGKFVVAYDEHAQYEGREVNGAHEWDAVPAGPVGIAASVPLAQKVDRDLKCLPVRPGQVNEYDVRRLPDRGPCAAGNGRINGRAAKAPFEGFSPPVKLIGPLGCERETTVDQEGRFAFVDVAPGLYLVVSDWPGVASEARVTSGEAAAVELGPLTDELDRREARRTACGCRRTGRFLFRDGVPLWDLVPQRRGY